jgi:hypothetical protein
VCATVGIITSYFLFPSHKKRGEACLHCDSSLLQDFWRRSAAFWKQDWKKKKRRMARARSGPALGICVATVGYLFSLTTLLVATVLTGFLGTVDGPDGPSLKGR